MIKKEVSFNDLDNIQEFIPESWEHNTNFMAHLNKLSNIIDNYISKNVRFYDITFNFNNYLKRFNNTGVVTPPKGVVTLPKGVVTLPKGSSCDSFIIKFITHHYGLLNRPDEVFDFDEDIDNNLIKLQDIEWTINSDIKWTIEIYKNNMGASCEDNEFNFFCCNESNDENILTYFTINLTDIIEELNDNIDYHNIFDIFTGIELNFKTEIL